MKKSLLKCIISTAGLVMLSGCAAIAGMQKPISPSDFVRDQSSCPSKNDLEDQRNADPSSSGRYRDEVIAACVKAIDRHYTEFKASLHRESASANLATDILSLGLSGGASVAGGGAARGLSAGSAFVSGTGKSINKDVFFDMTLPAIEASMDAGRSQVLKGIVDAQRSDSTGEKYTLARAGYDIDSYEAAGNLYVAISQLTKTASAAAQAAQADVAASQQGKVIELTTVELFRSDIEARLSGLEAAVKALKTPADDAKMDALVGALAIALPANTPFDVKKGDVMSTIEQRVTLGDADKDLAAVGKLETDLDPILK